ncbi:MAG: 2-phospho-L-lactate guanylyltransferase [Caldilineaceae bacterium]
MFPPKQLWVVIPAKPLREGKSRLASALSAEARRELTRHFIQRTLAVVLSVTELAGVVVVSRDGEILALAEAAGAQVLPETGSGMLATVAEEWGLNRAVGQAASFVGSKGGDGLLFLPTDLPLLAADDIRTLAAAWDGREKCAVLAASQDGGTNALLLSPPDAIAPAFGVGSFARHLRLADERGLAVALVESEGLAWDVDTPEEYRRMAGIPE